MELVHDVLDKQVVDRNGIKMGRVDGIVVELRAAQPPKLVAIELGTLAIAHRVGPRTARLAAWLVSRVSGADRRQPHRIDWRDIAEIGLDVRLDLDVGQTTVHDWQKWLRERIIDRIPGA
jgi:sporulation protein YlmC with PRC-barrel domain